MLVRPLLKALHWLPVQERIIFKIATFVFRFCFILFFIVSCHHTFRCFSLYTLLLAHFVPVQMGEEKRKKNFLVQDGNLRALVTGRSLFRLPLSGTTFLLTSDTAVLSHSSKLLLEPFSLLLSTLV